jgi:hypothetical protein
MLARNPMRMDYQRKYEEIVADYNREKDRTTIEETFLRLVLHARRSNPNRAGQAEGGDQRLQSQPC